MWYICKIFAICLLNRGYWKAFQITISANFRLVFQTLEKNADAEIERLTRSSKQQVDQLHATHATDLKGLEKRLKTDQVLFLSFSDAPSDLFMFFVISGMEVMFSLVSMCSSIYEWDYVKSFKWFH